MSNPSGEQKSQVGPATDTAQVWFGPIEGPPPRTPAEEAAHQLDILRRELNYYAQHLRKARQIQLGHYEQLGLISGQQCEREQRLRRQEAQMAADRAALDQERSRLEALQGAHRDQLAQQRQELEQQQRQAQERLATEQANLDRLRGEFEQQQRSAAERLAEERAAFDQQRAAAELEWKAEQDRRQAELADLQRQHEDLNQQKKDLAWSEAALHKQREQLQKLRAEIAELQQANQAREDGEKGALREELATHRQQLAGNEQLHAEKDRRLVEQSRQLAELEQLLAAARHKLDTETAAYQQYEGDMRNEILTLRRQLEEKQAALSPPPARANVSTPVAVQPEVEAVWTSIPAEKVPEETELAAAAGLEEALAAKESEATSPAHSLENDAAQEEPEAADDIVLEPTAFAAAPPVGVDLDLDEELTFENGSVLLERMRGLIRADRQRVDDDLRTLQAHRGEWTADPPIASLERAPLTARRDQLERLRHEVQRDLERLSQETAGSTRQRTPPGKPEAPKPGPTKTRGTFMGLRRWLGG